MLNKTEKTYLQILSDIANNGIKEPTRTGIDAFVIPHQVISHDCSDGSIPLMTHKQMPWKAIRAEIFCFIAGIRSKRTFQEMGCNYWNSWCNPSLVKHIADYNERMAAALAEDDLGPIYNWNRWNQFNAIEEALSKKGAVPSRRMVVSTWQPDTESEQALPPCITQWDVTLTGDGSLHLSYHQRSADFLLGVPADLAGYGLLLHLLAHTFGYKPGRLTAFMANSHVYENHLPMAEEATYRRTVSAAPKLSFSRTYSSCREWHPDDCVLHGYTPQAPIKAPIAV